MYPFGYILLVGPWSQLAEGWQCAPWLGCPSLAAALLLGGREGGFVDTQELLLRRVKGHCSPLCALTVSG